MIRATAISTCSSLACASVAIAGNPPSEQGPATVNAEVVRDLLSEAPSRRIDVVCLGDSNQLFNGTGWQDGWTVALGDRYPMYATPLLGAGDNNAIGVALNTNADPLFPPVAAPLPLLEFNNPVLGVDSTPYGFLPTGSTIPAGSAIGMRLRPGNDSWPKNNFNAEHALRQHFRYGTFDVGPGAVFQPQVIQPGAFNILSPPISTATGGFGIESGFIDIPAGARTTSDITFRWFASGAPDGVGPVHGLTMRVEDMDQPTGQSVSTLYGVGGASATECAIALQATPEAHLREYFDQIRALQTGPKRILIRIAFGVNDFGETLPSVGPDGPFPGGTDAAVADDTRAIIDEINDVWTLAGWDHSELVFLLVGGHQRLEPEPNGYGFRQAIADVALDAPNIAFVNLYWLATLPEMLTKGWYSFPTGVHLSADGYEALSRFEVQAIERRLVSDINGDCIVDAADIGLLIADFGKVAARTDLNLDRFVDAADLGILLSDFGSMCDE